MRPERMAELVARWVRFYTRDLPTELAERRGEEIDADVHDHIEHERAQGTGDRRIAFGILSRMVRGAAADASWRGHHAPRGHRSASRSAVRVVLGTALVLLLPMSMLLFGDLAWGPSDFALAGVLLMAIGLVREAVARNAPNTAYKAALGVAVGAAFMALFLMASVGIVGEDGDPADLMFLGVFAVGIVGAVVARFRAHGMARALFATAVAQALVAVIALIDGKHEAPISSVWEILGLNGLFAALFVGSALLFRRAAR